MKREYADKINSLLQCFHFNKEFLEWNHDYSHQLLRHGVSHLYHFAMLQGENDEATLEELRNIIILITNGDIPKPYDLSSMDAEQPEAASKTVMFFKPLAVTVEVTPEMLQQLKQSAT
ncbi:hypothetical protein ELJ27_32795, partial [Klebsiella pneumoniae]|nr:hypothetical protein [Klebsiella pneumoniae]